ncbi:ankyrin-3-like isoform X2 [Montipora foliosa]|uniref:ankyrin-3-like isoform X2 n=1 Tax=Montipora foliosa TaxID=591990 RepID=UPI0035F21B62
MSQGLSVEAEDEDILEMDPGPFNREFGTLVHKAKVERDDDFRVLLFGRGDDEDFELRGYDIAVEAFADQRLKGKRYYLLFVGAPDRKQDEVRRRLLNLGITDEQLTVRKFVQSREKIKDLFCEVDLVIMPSKSHKFGFVVLEALSAGLPILVGSNSIFARMLEAIHFGDTCIVPSSDPAKWAKKIDGVRAKYKKRLGEMSYIRKCYEEKFSCKEGFADVMELLWKMYFNAVAKSVEEYPVRKRIYEGTVTSEGIHLDLKLGAVHITFPPDAMSAPTPIMVHRWKCNALSPPLAEHEAVVSNVIEISTNTDGGAFEFNNEVKLVLSHSAPDLKGYELVIKSLIDAETNEWEEVDGSEDFRCLSDIVDDYPSPIDIPDFSFPVVQADITECSTYAVVCRLRLSPAYTITVKGGTFSHPDYPDVTIAVPKTAVPNKTKLPLQLKLQEVSQKLFRKKKILPGPILRISPRAVDFLKPVTIQLPLSLGERYRRRDIEMSKVRVRVLSKESSSEEQEWIEITDKLETPPRFDGDIITFEVRHFSSLWTLIDCCWNKLPLRGGSGAVIDQAMESEIKKLDCVPKAASFLAFVPRNTRLNHALQLRLYCVPTCEKPEVEEVESRKDNVKIGDGSSDEPMYFNNKRPERFQSLHVSFQDGPCLKSLQISIENRGDLTISFNRRDDDNRLCELKVPLPPQRADLTDEHKKRGFDKIVSSPEEGGEDLKHIREQDATPAAKRLKVKPGCGNLENNSSPYSEVSTRPCTTRVPKITETETPSPERLEWLSMNLTSWKRLARRLGFSPGEIEGFDKVDEELAGKALSMLLRWKQKKGSDATYAVLCAALSHEFVGHKDLAEEVIKPNLKL